MGAHEEPAVVLLSGGLDSTTVLAHASAAGYRVHALSFDYGQRHATELGCAQRQARKLGVSRHEVIDLSHLGVLVRSASALVADTPLAIPKDRDLRHAEDIPVTYVPARNTLFLAYAVAWAEVIGASVIFIGVNEIDYSGYPDCRPEFIEAFENMANLATRAAVGGHKLRIEAPLIDLGKHEIIRRGLALGVDYSDTVSCYDPSIDTGGLVLACGRCDSCQLRRRGFVDAGVPDPTRYVPAADA